MNRQRSPAELAGEEAAAFLFLSSMRESAGSATAHVGNGLRRFWRGCARHIVRRRMVQLIEKSGGTGKNRPWVLRGVAGTEQRAESQVIATLTTKLD